MTAGNASGVNDGAAALLVGSREAGERAGVAPRGRILAGAIAGVEPRLMGLGPVPACRKALERAGLGLKDMDVIEINEAFATQVLGCARLLEIDPGDSRLNPNGGAIAIGHPLGASGARLALTALRQLVRRWTLRPGQPVHRRRPGHRRHRRARFERHYRAGLKGEHRHGCQNRGRAG